MDQNNKRSWGYFFGMTGLNVLLILLALAGIIFGVSSWLSSYTRHDERIDVPPLNGIFADEAIQFLESKGLQALVIDSVYANRTPGTVIEQVPDAGLPVKKGRVVYLTIQALGQRMVKMVEVRQGGSRQALSTLRSLGFVVDSVRQVAYDMDDLVLSVTADGAEMEPGREYPFGSRVVVEVGSTHVRIEAENEEPEEAWTE